MGEKMGEEKRKGEEKKKGRGIRGWWKKKKGEWEQEQRERGKKLRKEGILGIVKKINILKNRIINLK